MMRIVKRILLVLVALVLAIAGLFVIFVGPWPTYASRFEDQSYYKDAVAAIAAHARAISLTETPGRLIAGWAERDITPTKPGVPLAGYGDRRGKPSTGVHDRVYVKAIALSDGKDTAVLVGADILLVPDNVADAVRADVAKRTPLTADSLYFTASHTHSSVGAFGPGMVAKTASGTYDPDIPPFLTKAFADAIVEAYENLAPAKLGHGSVSAPEYIRNRTREAPVDDELSYLVVEKDDGKRCFVASFSAHPTVLSGDNMQFTAEYPGYLQRFLAADGTFAMYLGGAVGSMGPRAPEGPDGFARAQAMGEALAKLIQADAPGVAFETNVDIAAIGIPLELPPLQVRIKSTKWRLSKFIGPLLGLDTDGWMEGVRAGKVVFIGVPADFSGEISRKWKQTAQDAGLDLWATGFSGDYAGYVSPDEYYGQVLDDDGGTAYETGLMSWTGPHQEAYFTALKDHLVAALTGQT